VNIQLKPLNILDKLKKINNNENKINNGENKGEQEYND
jgi:hypothetical protein